MEFQPLEKKDKPVFDDYFQRQSYENSHFTFINLFMWRKLFHIHFAVEDDVLYIVSRWQGVTQLLQPFTEAEKFPAAINKQRQWCQKNACPFYVVDVDANAAEIYRQQADFRIVADRDNYDYVYNSRDLIELAGRKYHTKKNHFNSFWRTYPETQYLPITKEITADCQKMTDEWTKLRHAEFPDDPLIIGECEAIREIFSDFEYFGVKGGALKISDQIVAFSFGEQFNPEMAVIHVEKADPEIRGAFAAINQAFAREWQDCLYINREEDMGIAGLRQAKESYKPVRMVEKYNVTEG